MPRVSLRRGLPGSLALAVLLFGVSAPSYAADDGVVLQVSYGPSTGEVVLSWTGGVATYRVYRSTLPANLEAPPNLIGTTAATGWFDAPPGAEIVFYRVHPPCSAVPYCDAHQYCDAADACAPDQSDGSQCGADAECSSGHCGNGHCCATGDCCATAADCAGYVSPAACINAATCQGTRTDATCTSFQCGSNLVDDDSACGGLESQSCGPYPSVHCTGAVSQPTDQAALCPASCADDNSCDVAAHCDNLQCFPDEGQGGTCDEPSDCSGAFSCTDAVCCDSACTGTCMLCDTAGSLGTCAPVPLGTDPDNECGGISCVGFYHSWSGDSCRRKSDVAANITSCDGAGACRTQAQECTAQTGVGPVTVTCNATCQTPNLATCSGTIAGLCTNDPAGSQSCGVGQCLRTTAQCANGVPVTCVPGPPSTETCNNLDDNCNGTIDDGNFGDGFEPNPDCGSPRTLATAQSDAGSTYTTMTVYPSGDGDLYRIPLTETDGSCGCGFSTDEDYEIRVSMTVPTGAGSFVICMNTNSCTFPGGFCFEVGEGQTINLSQFLDGACPGQDDYTTYVSIRGDNPPGFECLPYTLSYFFDAGLCR